MFFVPLWFLNGIPSPQASPTHKVPDWTLPPTMAQVDSLAELRRYGARIAMDGAAADPTWGLLSAHLRYSELKTQIDALRRAGVPAITWVEGFGDCTNYVAALSVDKAGKLLHDPHDPTLPRVLLNHWGWQELPKQPPHRVVWMGPQAYFDDADWARPYTRPNPRYGAPVPRYPDGRPALGSPDGGKNPALARLYDAGGSKDLNGVLRPVWAVNTTVNSKLASNDASFPKVGAIPITVGTDEIDGPAPGPSGSRAYATHFSIHKDAACPFWLDYAQASYRQILDLGLDGLWCDNFSAWDNFGYPPIEKSFGDWSVARFAQEANRWGLASSLPKYDIRADLKARFRRYFPGRDPSNLADPGWRDARWLDDPAWRAYRSFKRRVGAEALAGLASRLRQEAKNHGRAATSVVLTGNDVPLYDLGWVRPSYLDMVNTELSPGWHMGTGSFGTGFLPEGRLSPVYRLMTEYGRLPYAEAWLYLEGEYAPLRTKPGAFQAAAEEALLGRTLLLGYNSSGRTAGTPAEHRAWNQFVDRGAKLWRNRKLAPEAAVLWSPSSQLAFMTPGGYANMDAQPHVFGYFGWATYLDEKHVPYRALPEFSVTDAALKPLRLLILPHVECLSDAAAETLRKWVRGGGTLLITGEAGTRFGEDRAAARRPAPLFAKAIDDITRTRLGRGQIISAPGNPGMDYYTHRKDRARFFASMETCLSDFTSQFKLTAPRTVGISLYREPTGAIQIDLADMDLDRKTDVIRPAQNLALSFPRPVAWKDRSLSTTILASSGERFTLPAKTNASRFQVTLPELRGYVTLRIAPAAK